jgi:Phage integrase family
MNGIKLGLSRLSFTSCVAAQHPSNGPLPARGTRDNKVTTCFRADSAARPRVSTRQYARIVRRWVQGIGLNPAAYGTHTMRRTKAALIYRRTKNLRVVQLLLGHSKLESTLRYWGSKSTTLWRLPNRLRHDPQPGRRPASTVADRPLATLGIVASNFHKTDVRHLQHLTTVEDRRRSLSTAGTRTQIASAYTRGTH